MKILDLIQTRRTIHSYTEEKVSREVIENSILAAIHAPNHKMTWPWRFIVAGAQVRKKLGDLSVKLKSNKSPMTDVAEKAMRKKYNDEGSLVIAAISKSENPATLKEDYAAMACAIQNMSLYLHEQGFGSKWSTGAIIAHNETYKMLDWDPQLIEICGFIWIGKPRGAIAPIPRPALEQFLKFTD